MGLVTVCKYRQAKNPFFVEQAGLNLYSLEELAWFLYHNICLADRQMFDSRLCKWISEEVGYPELAQRIQNGIATGTNFQNLVLSVISVVSLFNRRELSELGERLKSLTSLQEQERLKMRADELLDNHNEWAAISEYYHILRMHQNNKLGALFYGAIWNNLGVCYARQFYFKMAAECFDFASEYLQDADVERQADLARKLSDLGKLNFSQESTKEGDFLELQKTLLKWERDYRMRQ